MASIRSIAKLSGVSKATVSRILNHDETFSVSDETKKRVLDIAERLNYSLSNNVSKDNVQKLHIVIINCLTIDAETRDPYFSTIKIGIEKQAAIWGMTIAKEIHLPSPDYDFKELATFGAVIVIGTMTKEGVDRIHKYNQNIVIINDPRYFDGCDVIRNDFGYQTRRVLDLMKDKGYQNIAFIGGAVDMVDEKGHVKGSSLDSREQAYLDWMKLNDLQKYSNAQITDWRTEGAMKATKQVLAKEKPSAILVASDPQAIGVYRAVQEAGYSIPNDIAVVSFDDIDMVKYLYPALTTVRPAAEEMGKEAINLVRERVVDNRKAALQVTINSTLVVRESL